MWRVRRCGDKIWQKRSTKHLSTGWLAGLKQQTWLSLYLECQQLNYYTAQRERVCWCVHMHVCVCVAVMVLGWGGGGSVVLRSKVYRWMTHPPIMWLINHCSYHFPASSWIFRSSHIPPFFPVILVFSHLLYVFLQLFLHWCSCDIYDCVVGERFIWCALRLICCYTSKT